MRPSTVNVNCYSKLKIPGRNKNIFDLSPKERLEMLQDVQKSRESSFKKDSKKLKPAAMGSHIFIPPEIERDKAMDVYVLFAFCAFLLCFCLPLLIQRSLLPSLLGNDLKQLVDIVTKNEVKFSWTKVWLLSYFFACAPLTHICYAINAE